MKRAKFRSVHNLPINCAMINVPLLRLANAADRQCSHLCAAVRRKAAPHHADSHSAHHRRVSDPAPGARRVRADAGDAWCGADDGYHAVIARLITGIFECADPAAIVPNHDPAALRFFSRFCNGLFVAVALNVDGNDGSSFVVMEKEAVKCHSRPPAFAAARGGHGRGNMTEIK